MDHRENIFQGVGGLDLYFQRWGPSGGHRAILAIVHGFGEHSGRYMNIPKRCINIPINQGCHSREGGNPDRNPGFRVKPGMTNVEGLQK
jgi:hypothetical protein